MKEFMFGIYCFIASGFLLACGIVLLIMERPDQFFWSAGPAVILFISGYFDVKRVARTKIQ